MGLDFLTAALGLSLWVAFGSLTLASAEGLGDHPVRRALVGAAFVAIYTVALWQRGWVVTLLRARPDLVVGLALLLLALALFDQRIGGPFTAVSLTPIGVASVVARGRTVWICVGVLMAGYAAVVFSADSPAALADDGDLGGVLGVLVSFPVAAALLLTLRRLLYRLEAAADEIVPALRAGAPTLTPELGAAIAHPGAPLLLGPAGKHPPVRLTETEIKVVEELADGYAPKEIAVRMGNSLATIRTHIRHAKRKTAARTLRELAGLATHPEWPNIERLKV